MIMGVTKADTRTMAHLIWCKAVYVPSSTPPSAPVGLGFPSVPLVSFRAPTGHLVLRDPMA